MITINNADVFYNESLKNRCTFKVGGRAKVLLCPKDCESFLNIIKNLRKTHESWFVLGGGSNIVPKDEDFDGYVLSTEYTYGYQFDSQNLSVNSDYMEIPVGGYADLIIDLSYSGSLFLRADGDFDVIYNDAKLNYSTVKPE